MNIAQLVSHTLNHYGVSIELLNNQSLRLHHCDDVPKVCTNLAQKYKAQLLHHLQLQSSYELIDYIQQEGVIFKIINDQTLRLHNVECLTDTDLLRVKQSKEKIIEILGNLNHSNMAETLDLDIQQEVINAYFERLNHHRSNLRKINSPVENALVKPEHVRQELIRKFALDQNQAQQFIDNLIEQNIFYYDSNFRFYLFPNFTHSAMTSFQHHNALT